MKRHSRTEAEIRDRIRALLRDDVLHGDIDLRDGDFEIGRLPDSDEAANWTITNIRGDRTGFGPSEVRAIGRAMAKVALLFDVDWG